MQLGCRPYEFCLEFLFFCTIIAYDFWMHFPVVGVMAPFLMDANMDAQIEIV
jgi:hypothetical protein